MNDSIVLFGCPRTVGGANVEAGDTATLWRKMGKQVLILPVGNELPDNPWLKYLTDRGCTIMPAWTMGDPPRWLRGRTIVDFCIERCVNAWGTGLLQDMGCKLIHVPCMTSSFSHEYQAFLRMPPTAVVFQSKYQRSLLAPVYRSFGVPAHREVVIHGAFNKQSFSFLPRYHRSGHTFTVGRLARDVPAKWPPRLWPILMDARQRVPIEGDMLGWTPEMGQFTGNPPAWIRCHPPGSIGSWTYLCGLHAILCVGECAENWSRVVLEAFATGVPVIADNRGGYREQIIHGHTGALCDEPEEASEALVRLATDECYRVQLATNARDSLDALASPEKIAEKWNKIFNEIST